MAQFAVAFVDRNKSAAVIQLRRPGQAAAEKSIELPLNLENPVDLDSINDLGMSPDGRFVAVALNCLNQLRRDYTTNGSLVLWDTVADTVEKQMEHHHGNIRTLSVFGKETSRLIAGGNRSNGTGPAVTLWDYSGGKLQRLPLTETTDQNVTLSDSHNTASVKLACFAADGQATIEIDNDRGEVLIYRELDAGGTTIGKPRKLQLARKVVPQITNANPQLSVTATALAADPVDKTRFAIAMSDKLLFFASVTADEFDREIVDSGHTGRINCVCYSRDGTVMATASDDKSIKLWSAELAKPQLLATLHGHGAPVLSCCFSEVDGQPRLFSSDKDGVVRVWIKGQYQLEDVPEFSWRCDSSHRSIPPRRSRRNG